jgi:hypothetical protein
MGLHIDAAGTVYASIRASGGFKSSYFYEISVVDVVKLLAVNNLNIKSCTNCIGSLSRTVFLSETKHFSVYNCDFLKHKYSRPASNYDGFLFASDLSSYTTCYPRPAIGYLLPLTALSPATISTSTITDPWTAAPPSTEFTVSSSNPSTTGYAELDFTKVRYDPDCEAVTGTLAESPTTMEVLKFRIGVTETLALVGVQLDAIFNPTAPITY